MEVNEVYELVDRLRRKDLEIMLKYMRVKGIYQHQDDDSLTALKITDIFWDHDGVRVFVR